MNIVITTDRRGSSGYGEMVASRLAYTLTERGHRVLAPLDYGIGQSALDGAMRAGGIPVGFVAGGRDAGTIAPGLGGTAQRCELVYTAPDGVPPNRELMHHRSEMMLDEADVVVVLGSFPRGLAGATNPSLDGARAEARDLPVFRIPDPTIPPGVRLDSRDLYTLVHDQVTSTVADVEAVLGGHPGTPVRGVGDPEYQLTDGDRSHPTRETTPPLGVPTATQSALTI